MSRCPTRPPWTTTASPSQARRHERRRRAHRRAGGGRRRQGRPRPHRAVRGLPHPGRGGRSQRVRVGGCRGARDERGRSRTAGRRPARRQGPLLHGGRPVAGRLQDPRGLPAAVHRHGRAQARDGGRAAARQDEPGRVRDGLVERELRLRAGAQPLGPHARPGRLERRQRRRGRGRARAVGARNRHRRLDPPARRAVRHRRPEADVRGVQPLRDDRVRLVARPGRPAHARRDRRRAALPPHGRPRRARLDVARVPRGGAAPERRAPGRHPPRRARRPHGRGRRAGRHGALRGDAANRPRPRRDRRAGRAAARRLRPERLLRARAGRGELQPRAVRRRALRAAPRRDRPADDVHEDAPRRLRPRGQAAHPHRHVRAVERLLRRLLRPGPAGPHEDRRRLPRGVRARRLRRHADESRRRLRARLEDERPARHVPQRLLHRAVLARRHPRDLDPVRAERGPPGGVPARRAGLQREPGPRRGVRARAGDRLRQLRSARMSTTSEAPANVTYEPVIGLEIHVQLSTRTKMFCGCELSFGEPPNTRTCEVCLGLPGALPVANAEAIHYGLMIGLALGCDLAPQSIFHRKNYFYPDLPKGYQISQYDEPLCRGGRLGDVRIHRVHLEEDAAKLVHAGTSGRIHGSAESVVDFNRGGTPLAEIVTEPDLRAAEDCGEWLRLLRATLRQLGVSDVNMEEGSLRCDANVSIRPAGRRELGTKTELKNMNSFRFLEKGIRAEIARQEGLLRAGEEVVQETLHFDPRTETLTPLRSKEEAHDYRYFPEPDLTPVTIIVEMLERARAALPELPAARAERFERDLGLSPDSARLLAWRAELGDYFETALEANGVEPQPLANWVNELVARIEVEDPAQSRVEPGALATLVGMVAERQVTQNAAKQVLDRLVAEGGDPRAIVEREGLGAIAGGDTLEPIVQAALDANPDVVEKLRTGNMKPIGVIVGYVMKETRGRADGGEVTRIARAKLGL